VLTAFTFDAAPLFVPGVAFVFLGVLAPLWVWFLARTASVERRLEQDRVVEGEPLEAMVEVHGWIPGGHLSDPLLSGWVRLPGGRRTGIRVLARFERRGRRHLAPPAVAIHDPLGLAESTIISDRPAQDVLVLPRTERVSWTRPGRDGAEPASRSARADLIAAVEVDGLRPYRLGTPASRIHWPALARGAGLLERRLRVDGDQTPLVVLDPRGASVESDLDAAVRAAASLTLELARKLGCRILLPGSRRPLAVEPDLVAWPTAHTRLALIEGGPQARAPALAGVRAALGALFYVTPRRIDRLESTLGNGGFAGTTMILVVPAGAGGRVRPSFTVAGCVGFTMRFGRHESIEREAA
jgi:uncharacterized protein (DUF58 family)